MLPAAMAIEEHAGDIGGVHAVWRSAPGRDGAAPVLYVHGVPTDGEDWLPFLERTGGLAPDLPGFGRSDKSPLFQADIEGYADWLDAFLAAQGAERCRLVIHDWGSVGLALAQRAPERIERLVVINAVPFLPGYRWHRLARVWRTRGAGEILMGASTRWGLRQISRHANVAPGPMPGAFVDRIWDRFDQGTQRTILRLYRSAPSDVLEAAGRRLGALACPALVLWGEQDPYIPVEFARAYARALPAAELELLPDAGHWPWIDRPDLVDRVAAFLEAPPRISDR
jgi:pimeloyl-ACP methyl ester carboxylesterase